MESNSIKLSTIQFVEEQGEWSNGQQTFLKYKLHLNNGEKPEFLAKSKKTIESFNQGDEVRYSYKKEGQSFAKIEREDNNQNFNKMSNNNTTKNQSSSGMTQQESIARSVGWNNVSSLVFSEEFQKYDEPNKKAKDENGKNQEVEVLFSDRQRKMIKQAAEVAKYIYTEVITKPIINK
ncbi:MAG: hypothetical protein CMJ05_09385 [Pelagibacterales bacterium]|nr:hypothetical protein [Pelagibacterales bacterium]|tara:strand:+ start:935 stop:1468 length:534 start_codon:yes stop_codon:yes gene_type:complete